MEGSKAGRELPGVVDQVISMHLSARDAADVYVLDEKASERRLVCQVGNLYGLPAKDRSGRLELSKPPELGALLAKINRRAASLVTPCAPAASSSSPSNDGALPCIT
jgi:hypothetical protein